jgi:hypothetical protein
MAKKKDNRTILILAAVIALLALVNLYLFMAPQSSSVHCYKDVCLFGESDPVAEINELISSSDKAILVAEGDKDATQKSGFVSAALVTLAKNFGNKKEMIVGIKMDAGEPIECICSEFTGTNFTDCVSNTTEYCAGLAPGPSEIMLKVYYPAYAENKIIVEGRTVKFLAKSGADALAMVNFFEELFIVVQ